jgi:hypothetical protein
MFRVFVTLGAYFLTMSSTVIYAASIDPWSWGVASLCDNHAKNQSNSPFGAVQLISFQHNPWYFVKMSQSDGFCLIFSGSIAIWSNMPELNEFLQNDKIQLFSFNQLSIFVNKNDCYITRLSSTSICAVNNYSAKLYRSSSIKNWYPIYFEENKQVSAFSSPLRLVKLTAKLSKA